jgi:hypothetical protein
MIGKITQTLVGFLSDGTTGNLSSSRLIACGAATIMACYLGADIVARWCGMTPMDVTVATSCVAGLVTLGGGVYVANKVAAVKHSSNDS